MIGWLVFWVTRPDPLPHNVQRVGNTFHVDVSEGSTDDVVKKNCLFVVPKAFNPKFSIESFMFNLRLPDGVPLMVNELSEGDEVVWAVVSYIKLPSQGMAAFELSKVQPKDGGLKNVPFLVESRNGLDMYQYDYGKDQLSIGTMYSFVMSSGTRVLVKDPGKWAADYIVYRKLTDSVELKYLFSKKQVQSLSSFVSDVTRVDNVVIKTLQSFQSK